METDERCKIGYSGAIGMASLEGRMIWSAFRTIMGANAILVTLAGAAMKVYHDKKWLLVVMSLFGIMWCIVWFLTLARQFSYWSYWIDWARHLEKQSLAPNVEMFEKGKSYGEGAAVKIAGQDKRMSWFGRVFKVRWLMSTVILMFLVLYVLEIILSLTN